MKINDSYELVIDDIGCYILKHHYISQKTGNDRVKELIRKDNEKIYAKYRK